MNTSKVIDEVFQTFRLHGHRHYGENVTETMHALQCATFAMENGEASVVIAACLLHDYGHLVHDLGEDIANKGIDAHHETLGANQLSRWFKEDLVEPVRLHVAAKRYLCLKNPKYLEGLSEASRRSLFLQGGPMSEQEGLLFEANPHYQNAVRLRLYDDMGKLPDMKTPDFEDFRKILEEFVLERPTA